MYFYFNRRFFTLLFHLQLEWSSDKLSVSFSTIILNEMEEEHSISPGSVLYFLTVPESQKALETLYMKVSS